MRKYLGIILLLFVMAALLMLGAALAHGQVCAAGQYDMAEWLAPQGGVSNSGSHNQFVSVFPQDATFYWVKGVAGYPWDVKAFDKNYVYNIATEYSWTDPHTYKNFETPVKMTPRCVNIPTTPGKLTSVPTPSSAAWFDIHTSCSSFTRHNLGYIEHEVWGPYTQTIGGGLPAGGQELVLAYLYNCSSTYGSCGDKETYELMKGIGNVRWTHYKLINNVYQLQNQSTFPQPGSLNVTPVHPCW